MTSLTPLHQRQIVEAIACAERRTAATLRVVLARRADDYAYLPLFWAALLALAVPCLLQAAFGWHLGRVLLLMHGVLFIGLCLLLRGPRLHAWLVPSALRRRQASRLARRQFALQCPAPGGLLIFICEAERYVQILHDASPMQPIDAVARHAVEAGLRDALVQDQLMPGLLGAIEQCADWLAAPPPAALAHPAAPSLAGQRLVLLD